MSTKYLDSTTIGSICFQCLGFGGHASDNVRFARVRDGKHGNTEQFAASRAQLNVVPVVLVHSGLGQHGVVLDLAAPSNKQNYYLFVLFKT